MTPDKDTLQELLNKTLADLKTIADGLQQRAGLIEKLKIEVEQHRGAQAYANQQAAIIQTQLDNLAKTAATSATS